MPWLSYIPVKLRSPDIHETRFVRNLLALQALSKVFLCH